jgi:hypothetical protein
MIDEARPTKASKSRRVAPESLKRKSFSIFLTKTLGNFVREFREGAFVNPLARSDFISPSFSLKNSGRYRFNH